MVQSQKESTMNNAELKARLRQIKMLLTDVDGVLTDCGMYYTEKGDEIKKFNTRDGMGVVLLQRVGVKVGIITKERSEIVARRAVKLGITEVHQGVTRKIKALAEICKRHNLNTQEVCYIGDDVNDVPVLKEVGLGVAPADAVPQAKAAAFYVTEKKGGEGVVREVANMILEARALDPVKLHEEFDGGEV